MLIRKKYLYSDRDWLYNNYINKLRNVGEIANECGCTPPTIGYYLKKFSIKRRPKNSCRSKINKLLYNKEWLIQEYIENNKSIKQLSIDCNCSDTTIRYYLRYFNIPMRKRWDDKLYRNYDWLYNQYVTLQKSAYQISIEYNYNYTNLLEWFKRHNIELRSYSESLKIKWKDINYLNSIEIGILKKPSTKLDKNPNWKGGISFEPYCFKFNNEFKEKIRNLFNRTCFICHKPENMFEERLHIHHIDYNKNSICNGKSWAFIPLCRNCHGKTSSKKRWYWFNLLINYWLFNENILLDDQILDMGDYICTYQQ